MKRSFAFGLQAAGVGAAFTVLVHWRGRRAAELEVIGAMPSEIIIIGALAVVSALVVPRLRDSVPAGLVLFGGSALTGLGLSLMAWTIELGLFTIGGVLAGIGVGPALVLPRVLITSATVDSERRRAMSRYWAAAAAGAAAPLCLDVVADLTAASGLWIAAALMWAAAALLLVLVLEHDEDVRTEETAAALDAPWVRRSCLAAAAAGALAVGAAQPSLSLLQGEWQRSLGQQAAVLAVAPLAALLANTVGDWYHRLGRLTGSRRADAIGLQLFVAGLAASIGGLSFTFIGLIVAWAIAGAALGLAATGLDTATFPSVEPSVRRRVATRQVVWFAGGGALATAANVTLLSSVSDQWRVAVPGVGLLVAGWWVRRFADTALDADIVADTVDRTTVPRRVEGLEGNAVPMLSVQSLEVAYGQVQVLFGVDLVVKPGQIVALLGPNGAGKTTLLRAISGLEPTIGGRVLYNGLDVTKTKPTWRSGMGLQQIVGGEAVAGSLTVEENLSMFATTVPAKRRREAIEEAFEAFERLRERRNQQAATLSGGEKQMLALAKALMVRPQMLLIDEFSLGLAPTVIADLLPMVRQVADQGTAVLIVEQSVQIALSIADYAYVMEKGEIAHSGEAAVLRDQPDLLRAAYLEGLTNVLAGDER